MYSDEKSCSGPLMHRQFKPPFYMKNPILQTVLSSLKFKNKYKEEFDFKSEEIIVNAGNGIKLSGYYSDNSLNGKNSSQLSVPNIQDIQSEAAGQDSEKTFCSDGREKLLILFHGWEGSEKSAYMVTAGRFFFRKGYSVFRLNMRDHGNTHHLNKGLFYGTLIEEVFSAVKEIAGSIGKGKDIFIAGFSIGGNFSLRIAELAGKDQVLKNSIKKVFAVNPPLNPRTATSNIDKYFIIKKYFLWKWKKSLLKKERIFPSLYNFSMLPQYDSCINLTDILIKKYSEFSSLDDYFSRYTLKEDFFKKIKVPVFVITSEDDPIIDSRDFEEIKKADNPFIELQIEKHGGHCAYIKNLKFETWLFDTVAEKAG